MQRRFRQVLCAVKEHTSMSYAKFATVGGFCDINLIVVRATAPDDLPLNERYIQELLKIFTLSPSSFHSFSLSFSRRFSKTHCWKVALKCLLLLHRLLRSMPEHSGFRSELLWHKTNGFLPLYPCFFRDDSSSTPQDYTHFIRSYARLLNEALECFCLDENQAYSENEDEDEDEDHEIKVEEKQSNLQYQMNEVARRLGFLPQLQSLIDRVMDCRPTGAATRSFVVQSTMKYIIRDSFICYTTFRRDVILVLDNLIQIPHRSCIAAFEIYKKAAFQADQLCWFYDWCKAKGLCGSYEYPFIDRIPQIQIQALEAFLNGMWQLSDQSSSSTTSPCSWMESKSSLTEDDYEKRVVGRDIVVNTKWEIFEEHDGFFPRKVSQTSLEEVEPLIQVEDDKENDDQWEALLEASLSVDCGHGIYGKDPQLQRDESHHQWQMQVYNPNYVTFNPFCQPYVISMSNCNGSVIWK